LFSFDYLQGLFLAYFDGGGEFGRGGENMKNAAQIDKRLTKLESLLLPKPTRPALKIITRHVADELGDVDADHVMIMPRPGDIDPHTLTLTIVDTAKGGAAKIKPDPDPEPTDDELQAAVEQLERRLKDGGGRP